jgi:hypothetical protein
VFHGLKTLGVVRARLRVEPLPRRHTQAVGERGVTLHQLVEDRVRNLGRAVPISPLVVPELLGE